jgi:hypothetical protein
VKSVAVGELNWSCVARVKKSVVLLLKAQKGVQSAVKLTNFVVKGSAVVLRNGVPLTMVAVLRGGRCAVVSHLEGIA